MTESEIWCSADTLIKKHGSKAAMEAAMKADKMLARNDKLAYDNWTRITLAIRELQNGEGNAN